LFRFGIVPEIHIGRHRIIYNWWDYFLPRSSHEVVGVAIEKRLQELVERLNNSQIDFVISVGDLTDSMTDSQVKTVKKIMRHLRVPWVPLMGNHDIWPYEYNKEGRVLWNANQPIDFREFKKRFKEEFHRSQGVFKEWKEQGDFFQNISFIYSDTKFIVVDNVSRRRALFGLPGNIGFDKLHRESLQWLHEELKTPEKKIVILSHHPLKIKLQINKKILKIAGHRHKFKIQKNKNTISVVTNALYVTPEYQIITVDSDFAISLNYLYGWM